MKIKNILPVFIIMLAGFMVGCNDEQDVTLLKGVQVSPSYVSIPMDGGSDTITVSAKGAWTLSKVFTGPVTDKDTKQITSYKDSLSWLTVSQISGDAGETEIIFSADGTLDGRSGELLLQCGSETQHINVIQGLSVASPSTVAQVNAGPDGKTFQVTGTVSSITSASYGDWYITDETGTLYVYGTTGFADHNPSIEVGDEVTVEGIKTTYNGTVELTNATIINVTKSLIKVDSVENDTIPVDGGEATVYVTCKGQGVTVNIPDDAQSWLSIASINTSGTNSTVAFKAAANTGGDRSTTITFHTTDTDGKDYTSQTTIAQKGAIVTSNVADFIAAPLNSGPYRLSGVITSVKNASTGDFMLKDYSGEVEIYKIADFASKGMKVGDVVTVVGTRGAYGTTVEMTGGVTESYKPVAPVTVAEFLAVPNTATDLYSVTGTIVSIVNADYGNIIMQGDDGSLVYTYGCYPGWGATGDARKGLIAAQGIKVGDQITVIGSRTTYTYTNPDNGQKLEELNNGVYYSHVSK